jgi:hypothetical protein
MRRRTSIVVAFSDVGAVGTSLEERTVNRHALFGAAIFMIASAAGCDSSVQQLSSARNRANDAATVANIRTLISAEIAYSSNNGGFGSLECLSNPKSCVPDDPGQPYLTKGLLSGERSGYTYEFVPGPETSLPGRAAGSNLKSFAVVATPANEAAGSRIFCGDSTGSVCILPDDAEATGGACPASCEPMK